MLELKGICYSAEDESRETEILKDIDVTIDDRLRIHFAVYIISGTKPYLRKHTTDL